MIRGVTEGDLQNADADEIYEMMMEGIGVDRFPSRASAQDIKMALVLVDQIRKQPAPVRAAIAQFLSSSELFCRRCGKTSCLCGYSDE